jgi:hypothetical protein
MAPASESRGVIEQPTSLITPESEAETSESLGTEQVERTDSAADSNGFPTHADVDLESWAQLFRRFLNGCEKAAAITHEAENLERMIRCPSRPGAPVRTMPTLWK